jgi:hypothetical protein
MGGYIEFSTCSLVNQKYNYLREAKIVLNLQYECYWNEMFIEKYFNMG